MTTILLVILGAWIAAHWLMAGVAVLGAATWIATMGKASDTDNLIAWIFLLAIIGVLAEIFI